MIKITKKNDTIRQIENVKIKIKGTIVSMSEDIVIKDEKGNQTITFDELKDLLNFSLDFNNIEVIIKNKRGYEYKECANHKDSILRKLWYKLYLMLHNVKKYIIE